MTLPPPAEGLRPTGPVPARRSGAPAGARSLYLLVALALAVVALPAIAGAQTLTGIAWDGRKGSPVAGALIRILDVDANEVVPATVRSGSDGRFTVPLPREPLEVWVMAEKEGYASSAPWPVSRQPGQNTVAGLLLEMQPLGPPPESLTERGEVDPDRGTARVVGFVIDRENNNPVGTAQVEVVNTTVRTITDPNGMFVLEDIPPGQVAVAVSHLSYATAGRLLRLEPGRSYEMRVGLSPEAIALEGIEVTARSTNWFREMQGLKMRMNANVGGTFVLDTDFERRGYPPVAEMLRGLAGVRLRKAGRFGYDIRFRNCSMAPVVWVDGVQVNEPEEGGGIDVLNFMSGVDVQAVELYRGAATVPPEFSGPDAMCGALVIWTKRGG
jgi:hypothetical protein